MLPGKLRDHFLFIHLKKVDIRGGTIVQPVGHLPPVVIPELRARSNF